MVIGPTLLRSIPGAISTEIIIPTTLDTNSSKQQPTTTLRIRVIFQHAPVWETGVQPGSCPPQGLKLFRMILCRETLMDDAITTTTTTVNSNDLHPYFKQNIPPYQWHKKWAGTSWTCTFLPFHIFLYISFQYKEMDFPLFFWSRCLIFQNCKFYSCLASIHLYIYIYRGTNIRRPRMEY